MAIDATGTATSLGIPKYDTANNIPSGKGFNAAIDAINALLTTKTTGLFQMTGTGRVAGLSGDLPGYGSVSSATRTAHISALDLIKMSIQPTYSDGVNGTARGDSITSDAANASDMSTWSPLWIYTPSFAEKGSNQLLTLIGINDQPSGGGNAYNELLGAFINITANRKGALTEGIEVGVTSNVAARANTITVGVSQNVTMAQYTTDLSAGSKWATTGARGIWILSAGSQAAGTGIFLEGAFNVGVRHSPATPGQIVMQSQRVGEAAPRVTIAENGTISMGDGTNPVDVSISRPAAGELSFAGQTRTSGLSIAYYGGAGQVLIGAGQVTFGLSQDAKFQRIAADVIGTPGSLEYTEHVDLAAGAVNTARVYARDNGSGKTQLVVRFNTGAIQILATEP